MTRKGRGKQHANRHHVYPTSRFKLKKDPRKHNAWHQLFENKTPEEAIEKVKKWTTKSGMLNKDALMGYRLKAWKMLFGQETSPEEAIQIIEKDWTFPGVRLVRR